jgi:hypothetical protein
MYRKSSKRLNNIVLRKHYLVNHVELTTYQTSSVFIQNHQLHQVKTSQSILNKLQMLLINQRKICIKIFISILMR